MIESVDSGISYYFLHLNILLLAVDLQLLASLFILGFHFSFESFYDLGVFVRFWFLCGDCVST